MLMDDDLIDMVKRSRWRALYSPSAASHFNSTGVLALGVLALGVLALVAHSSRTRRALVAHSSRTRCALVAHSSHFGNHWTLDYSSP